MAPVEPGLGVRLMDQADGHVVREAKRDVIDGLGLLERRQRALIAARRQQALVRAPGRRPAGARTPRLRPFAAPPMVELVPFCD